MANGLEKLYPYVPVWAQNIGISLYGLMYRRERLGGNFDRYVAEFAERDRFSPSEMDEYTTTALRRTLVRAFANVPYYHAKWAASALTTAELARMRPGDLSRLPITPKADVRQNPEAFVDANVARNERLHRYYTSGSTGTPITAICSDDTHRKFIAAREVRSFGWAGASVRMPRSMLGGRLIVPRGNGRPPYYRYNRAERQVYFTVFHIRPDSLDSYLEGFHRYRPQLLTGYAYAHFLLARMMREAGRQLDYEPTAIILGSEKLTSEMKEVIQGSLRARAYEEYGAVENCMLGTECSHGSLHVSPDFGILEIVNDSGEPVGPGEEGRVLCTGLVNEAQPLVRYEIGDVAAWSAEECPCGRNQLPVIKEIVGRLEDVVIGLDGREVNRFQGLFNGQPHIVEGQVVQETPHLIRVKVVPAPGFGPRDEESIRRLLSEERVPGMRVIVEQVAAIERTERGKFRAVVSHVPRRSRQSKVASVS